MNNDHIHRDAADRVRAVVDAVQDNKLDNVACLAAIREIVGEKQGRKIVQIQSDADGMTALCDDGTLWARAGDWTRILPDIPQDTPSPDPIAELEAMGGHLSISGSDCHLSWLLDDDRRLFVEEIPFPTASRRGLKSSDLRAAAARLLERIRGAK